MNVLIAVIFIESPLINGHGDRVFRQFYGEAVALGLQPIAADPVADT